MPRENTTELKKFLLPFSADIQELCLWLREFIWDLYPNANELIYDNYNALALGWSPTEKVTHTFCSIAVYAKYVHCGFYWGSEIADPKKKLLGKGSQYRYIIISKKNDLPKTYVKQLLREAWINSLAKVKDPKQIIKGATIVKSISPAKRRSVPVPQKRK